MPATTHQYALNANQNQTWLFDVGSQENNLNFITLSYFKGRSITPLQLQSALNTLAMQHELLHVGIKVEGRVPQFVELVNCIVPLTIEKFNNFEQWNDVAQRHLAKRFDEPEIPMWRAVLLQGKQKGILGLVFSHVINDGIGAFNLIDQLFRLTTSNPPQEGRFFPSHPLSVPKPHHPVNSSNEANQGETSYVFHLLSGTQTDKLMELSKRIGIRINSLLFALFIVASQQADKQPYKNLLLMHRVSLRCRLDPPIPDDEIGDHTVGVFIPQKLEEGADLFTLATAIQNKLDSAIENKIPFTNLESMEEVQRNQPDPVEYKSKIFSPPNFMGISNVGKLNFPVSYGNNEIRISKLFNVINCPFNINECSAFLAVNTLHGRVNMVLHVPKGVYLENDAKSVLSGIDALISKMSVENSQNF